MHGGVAPGDDAGPIGRADRVGGKHALKAHTTLRQTVDVRRLDDRVAIAAQGVRTQLIGGDEQNVGS